MSLEPPPELLFNSHDDAYKSTLRWAQEHGYGFSLRRSKPDGDRPKTQYTYQCIRRTLWVSRATIRRTSTASANCKFAFKINRIMHADGVTEQWKVDVTHPGHSHEAAEHAEGLSCHRKRSKETKAFIQGMNTAQIPPRKILSVLKEQEIDDNIQLRDIYNEQRNLKTAYFNGRLPIESLLDELTQSPEWVVAHRTDHENRLNALFFAHESQIKLIRAYPDVLLMDCTYRTNKYKMPLLHFLGVGPIEKQFSAAFTFLRSETELDYYWAVSNFIQLVFNGLKPAVMVTDNEKALRSTCKRLFPDVPILLCAWHVQQNVLGRAKATWRISDAGNAEEVEQMKDERDYFMARWDQVQHAKDEAAFEQLWRSLIVDYSSYPRLVQYLNDHQYPQRQLTVKAWTSCHRHYGNTTTSRIEGAHSYLKSNLGTSRGDLPRVINAIKVSLLAANHELYQALGRAKDRVPYGVLQRNNPFFPEGINNTITPNALILILQQYSKVNDPTANPVCTGRFTQIYGLPCHHHLRRKLEDNPNTQLEYSEIDTHWFFQRPNGHNLSIDRHPRVLSVLPPAINTPRGRWRRDGSTTRDLSHFELEPPPSQAPAPEQNPASSSSSTPPQPARGGPNSRFNTRGGTRGGRGAIQKRSQTPRIRGGRGRASYGGRLERIENRMEEVARRSENAQLSLTRAIQSLVNARQVSNNHLGEQANFSGGTQNLVCAANVTINTSPSSPRHDKADEEEEWGGFDTDTEVPDNLDPQEE